MQEQHNTPAEEPFRLLIQNGEGSFLGRELVRVSQMVLQALTISDVSTYKYRASFCRLLTMC
jgi:hypothetical protein